MRANNFQYLSNTRSVMRIADRCDLSNEHIYSIENLEAIKIKSYNNLNTLPNRFDNDFDVLQWLAALIAESPLGMALLYEAQDAGWRIAICDLEMEGYHLDITNKVIELDGLQLEPYALAQSSNHINMILLIFAKALRDVWHEERWGGFEENYKPEAVLMLERARAADIDCVSIFIAWELRSQGYTDIWRMIIGSEDGDIARVLINILERYPTALYNGMALAHMFRQWYVDEQRVDALDCCSLQQMDFILEENNVRFGERAALSKEFELLSCLPDGGVYLHDLGDTVAKDPFFNGLNDAVNQSHLFQIIYDTKVTYVHGIPFRDAKLARKFLHTD